MTPYKGELATHISACICRGPGRGRVICGSEARSGAGEEGGGGVLVDDLPAGGGGEGAHEDGVGGGERPTHVVAVEDALPVRRELDDLQVVARQRLGVGVELVVDEDAPVGPEAEEQVAAPPLLVEAVAGRRVGLQVVD